MTDEVLIEDHGAVQLVTLRRPEQLNAMNTGMFDALSSALDEAQARDDVAVVVLTGAGRAFSAGVDLQESEPASSSLVAPSGYEPFIQRFERFPKPVIAAVNGLAVGIGFTLLGHCDLVLASSEARFKAPFVPLGLVPEAGSTVLLPQLVGRQLATHLLLSGRWLSAEEAHDCGMLYRLCTPEELMAAAIEVAGEIAQGPLASLTATKRLLAAGRLAAALPARQFEEAEFGRLLLGDDFRAAVQAFQQKS